MLPLPPARAGGLLLQDRCRLADQLARRGVQSVVGQQAGVPVELGERGVDGRGVTGGGQRGQPGGVRHEVGPVVQRDDVQQLQGQIAGRAVIRRPSLGVPVGQVPGAAAGQLGGHPGVLADLPRRPPAAGLPVVPLVPARPSARGPRPAAVPAGRRTSQARTKPGAPRRSPPQATALHQRGGPPRCTARRWRPSGPGSCLLRSLFCVMVMSFRRGPTHSRQDVSSQGR